MRPFRRIENKRSRRPDLGGTNSRLHKSEYGTQEGTRSTNAGPTAEVRYGSQSDTLAARLPESCSCSSSRFNKSAVMGIELLVSDRTAVVPAELRSLTEFVPGCVGCIVGHSERAPAIGPAGRHAWLAFRRLPFQGLPRPSA